jgi:uncharacterized protein YbjT (DUF2867 family)
MNESQLIAVLGATGAQGGGLVRAILADPARTFAVRAISRRVDSPAARTLASLGAEVVQGDLDDLPSLKRAFAGAHGVFGVTTSGNNSHRNASSLRPETLRAPRKTSAPDT